MKYLVSYDIASDRHRTKAAKILEDYGVRIQYSVFECSLNKKKLSDLKNELDEFINKNSDSLMFFPLCENCYSKKTVIGNEYCVRRISIITVE